MPQSVAPFKEQLKTRLENRQQEMEQMQMRQDLQRATEGARMFTQYAQVVWENIKQDDLLDDSVDDAVTLGTGLIS